MDATVPAAMSLTGCGPRRPRLAGAMSDGVEHGTAAALEESFGFGRTTPTSWHSARSRDGNARSAPPPAHRPNAGAGRPLPISYAIFPCSKANGTPRSEPEEPAMRPLPTHSAEVVPPRRSVAVPLLPVVLRPALTSQVEEPLQPSSDGQPMADHPAVWGDGGQHTGPAQPGVVLAPCGAEDGGRRSGRLA